jgi:hypothetical protein
MSWPRFRRRSKPRAGPAPDPPRRWPVDPELSRRVIDARTRLEHTRRELARHVPSDRRLREKRRT